MATSLPEEAKRTVKSLQAHGGSDCPDMGMSGLYLALLNSQPNSDVYYFSDADAKDSYRALSLISIAFQRECRIILFISGQCSSRRTRRSLKEREVYKKLASATGGQLIQYSKSNTEEAVKFVRRANISKKNSLFSKVSLLYVEVDKKTTVANSYKVQIDSFIASFTAVLSAQRNARIKLVSSQGIVCLVICDITDGSLFICINLLAYLRH